MIKRDMTLNDLRHIQFNDSLGRAVTIDVTKDVQVGDDCINAKIRVSNVTKGKKYGIALEGGTRELIYDTYGVGLVSCNYVSKPILSVSGDLFEHSRVLPTHYRSKILNSNCIELEVKDDCIDLRLDVHDSYHKDYGLQYIETLDAAYEVARLIIIVMANCVWEGIKCKAIDSVMEKKAGRLSSLLQKAEG